ncbi:MAG TPA: hypothetical protein VFY48_05950 [Solirubrobacterales bacterium]|nr:hypothetical protein [Solirubrobacterales bacterium]
MTKKLSLLGGLIAVVGALSLPSVASATWKHHGAPIQESKSGTVTGNARFQGALGGIECQATANAVFLASQTTGELQSYGAHPTNETTNCKGLGGLAFCQVHNWTATGLPWTFHTTITTTMKHIPEQELHKTTEVTHQQHDNTLTVTTGQTHAQFTGGFCPIKASVSTPGSVVITPNQPTTITSGQLSGSLEQHLQTNNGQVDKELVQISGIGTIVAPNAHTYDI